MPDLTAHFVDEAHSVFEQVQELARACPDELKDDVVAAVVAMERLTATAVRFAEEDGMAAPVLPSYPEGCREFYGMMIANLRWPADYGHERRLATLHSMLDRPQSEDEARDRIATWYAERNKEMEYAA